MWEFSEINFLIVPRDIEESFLEGATFELALKEWILILYAAKKKKKKKSYQDQEKSS